MITITAKFQILPTSAEQLLLSATMQAYSAACNFVSDHIFETHDLNQSSLNTILYQTLRCQFGLKSQMAQSTLKTVIARYKTILKTQKEWRKPNFRHPEYDLVWNRDYSLLADSFSVNTLTGRLKLKCHKEGMQQYFDDVWHFGTAKLVHKHKKWFLHIPVTRDSETLSDNDVCNVVGVDLGINFLATTYDSKKQTTFFNGRAIKQKRAGYKSLRSQLQRKQTPSARHRLKAIGQRENRWMCDVNHQISKALVDSHPTGTLFILEDLTGIRTVTEKVKRKNRYVSVSWAFFDFRQKLAYKALLAGDNTLFVDPAYTSQTCPSCGHTEAANRNKKKHVFVCKNCHYTSNDDRIGAMNLYAKGIQYLSTVSNA